MVKYTSMESIFPLLPIDRNTVSKDYLVELGAQCLQNIRHKANYERNIVLVEIDNFKGKLPIDLFRLEAVARYIHKNLNDCNCFDITTTEYDVQPDITTVTYETSTYTSNIPRPNSSFGTNYDRITSMVTQCISANFERYIGSVNFTDDFEFLEAINQPFTTGKHCDYAPNLICDGCPQKYTLSVNNEILTSFEKGIVFISYLREPVDENGIPIILDDLDVKQCIISFITMKYWESRMNTLERGAYDMYAKYQDQFEKLAMKVNAKTSLTNINTEAVLKATVDRYKHITDNGNIWASRYGRINYKIRI